jgi:serine/threonine protein kinase
MNSPVSGLGADVAPCAAGDAADVASGGYVIDACVHTSRTADLYRVHVAAGHSDPGFPLVMKLAHARADQDRADFVHSEVEHQLLPLLSGPHAPRFVASINLAHAPRLVREWVPGTLVQDWLDASQRPAIDEVLRLGVALARAVHGLHRQHVVHHDLQPSHVLVRPDGRVVLLGFGQACHAQLPDLLAAAVPSRRAASRDWQRTAAWLAPEQLLGVRGDARSDLFAIGVMLYQLLGGVLPFGAPQNVFALYRRLWTPPPGLQQLNPAVTPWLRSAIPRPRICISICCIHKPSTRRRPVWSAGYGRCKRVAAVACVCSVCWTRRFLHRLSMATRPPS